MDSEPDPRPGFAALGATPRCQSASVLNDRDDRLPSKPIRRMGLCFWGPCSDAPSALSSDSERLAGCIPNRRSGRLHVVLSGRRPRLKFVPGFPIKLLCRAERGSAAAPMRSEKQPRATWVDLAGLGLRATWMAVVLMTSLMGLPIAAAADQSPAHPRPSAGPAWPTLPFTGYIPGEFAYVRERPTAASKLIALLRTGDQVVVRACQPRCDAARAWALLEPRGALPLSALRIGERPAAVRGGGSDAVYFYGRLPRSAAKVYAAPSTKSKVMRKEKAEYRVAFVPDAHLAQAGWLRRPDGGYMRVQDVKLFQPSAFEGAHDPASALAFVRRKVALRPVGARSPPKDPTQVVWHQRYDRLPVAGLRQGKVLLADGWLPRSLVRVAQPMQRPQGVASDAKWMHIELSEQVLTAYEGDKMVFATLISSGKQGTSTKSGRFELYGKTVHGTMRGKPWDDYFAEEVPHVMHYDAGRALHAAYWHDQFGVPKSHGCINLSPADAAWLFAWIPPSVPSGWHSVLPVNWGATPVVVLVDKPTKRQTRPQVLASGPPQHRDIAKR